MCFCFSIWSLILNCDTNIWKFFTDSTSSVHMFIRWIMHLCWDLRNASDSKYIWLEKPFYFHSEFGCGFTYTCEYIIFLVYYSDNCFKKTLYLIYFWALLQKMVYVLETFLHLSVTFSSRKMFLDSYLFRYI